MSTNPQVPTLGLFQTRSRSRREVNHLNQKRTQTCKASKQQVEKLDVSVLTLAKKKKKKLLSSFPPGSEIYRLRILLRWLIYCSPWAGGALSSLLLSLMVQKSTRKSLMLNHMRNVSPTTAPRPGRDECHVNKRLVGNYGAQEAGQGGVEEIFQGIFLLTLFL